MIHIDFDSFTTEADFLLWLQTSEGIRVFEHVYDVIISNYGKPLRYIPVITKKWDDDTIYSIDMNNLAGFCERAIGVFEYLEDYEKCTKLINILYDIKNEVRS